MISLSYEVCQLFTLLPTYQVASCLCIHPNSHSNNTASLMLLLCHPGFGKSHLPYFLLNNERLVYVCMSIFICPIRVGQKSVTHTILTRARVSACVQVCTEQWGLLIWSTYIKIVCIFLNFIKLLTQGPIYMLVNVLYWNLWKSDKQFSRST
jgi:hypothetical protein